MGGAEGVAVKLLTIIGRYDIARLLEQLWGRVDCKASILRQAKSQRFQVVYLSVCLSVCLTISVHPSVHLSDYTNNVLVWCVNIWVLYWAPCTQSQAFLGAVFDTLLYQLTDSLQRITSVKKFEVAKEDSKYHIEKLTHYSIQDYFCPIIFSWTFRVCF